MENKLKKEIKNYVSSLLDNFKNKSEILKYMEEYISGFEENKRRLDNLYKLLGKELNDRDQTISDLMDHIDHLENRIEKLENG